MIVIYLFIYIIFKDTDEKPKEITATLDKLDETKSEESITIVKTENELSVKSDAQEESIVSNHNIPHLIICIKYLP